MINQRKLIDRIQSFSPGRERWVSRPEAGLPGKVTVHFSAGQTGYLDMKDPRAVHWAQMLDEQAQEQRPVYIEIDDETGVITNLRIPRICKVTRLDPDPYGNMRVLLKPSSAVHLLLKSDPNYDSMLTGLQVALSDGSELLITETRDGHEIIDVRKPDSNPGGGSGPNPPPSPDPPVSEARAVEVFNNMNAESCDPCNPSSDCIPFLYPDDGCWIRAHIMCHLMRTGGPDTTVNPPEDPDKVWIQGWLHAPTVNHPDCYVNWGWHVAPTLMVSLPAGDDKRVIDPSLSPAPESKTDWKNRQGDPGATLTDTAWTDYNYVGDTQSVSLAQAHTYMQYYRNELKDRCLNFGPPPYSCNKSCFFIIDRSTFSDDEVEAMLAVASPAVIQNAFYVVLDGFSPQELGFTAATMQHTPALNIAPPVTGMTISPDRLEFEDPSHLNRRQRLTWVYDVRFTNTNGFTAEMITVTMQASMSTESGTGHLYLIKQPNPYEIDGETSWLSTDLRVFQIRTGQSKFGVNMGSDPSFFITQVIANLNSGNTGGQTFDNDIPTDIQTSKLELAGTVGGTAVYNFAVAKVRYRALTTSATNVRVFFRLFPVATTSLAYNLSTAYRRHTTGSTAIPLLGIRNNEVSSIPCFAAPRVNSSTTAMTVQTDAANVQTIPPNAGGAEVVRYYGCWLDINQTQQQFPIQPSPVDGPWSSGRKTIQELIRNEHQCIVSEIAFDPAPPQNGSTPSVSDKLAQRNLAIVESANPGAAFSRRISQTFELKPSESKTEHDELMIDWGNIPVGSVATFFIPGIDAGEMMMLSAEKYRTHRLVRINGHTVKCDTGGITYLPIPFTDATLPGMLTVDLPEGVKKGQVYKVVVRQVTGETQRRGAVVAETPKTGVRHIVGSFQLTIPVSDKAGMLPGQQRLLSVLRWIGRSIPAGNRWAPVFGKYVDHVAGRVDALGGNSRKVAPSSSGEWQKAYRNCLILSWITVLLIAVLCVGTGTQAGSTVVIGGIPVVVLLAIAIYFWRKRCRPTMCQLLRTVMAGTGIGAVILAIIAIFGAATAQLISVLAVSAVMALIFLITAWTGKCFRK
ncbi:MAG: hypothetical protein JW861_11210 [Bacteroidales bacterium]|nr:hypothetical protein [Bacteroidales bacterium]